MWQAEHFHFTVISVQQFSKGTTICQRGGFFQHPHLLYYSWLPQIRGQMCRLPKHKGPITSASHKHLMS